MFKIVKFLILNTIYLSLYKNVDGSKIVLKDMSTNFVNALDACRTELNLDGDVMSDFYNFWKEDFRVTNRMTGCAIICLSNKLELFDPEGNLHHGNAKDFAKKHGADEDIAAQLVDMWHSCEKSVEASDDACAKVVSTINCFKVKIHEVKWAPDMEVAMAEVIAEV